MFIMVEMISFFLFLVEMKFWKFFDKGIGYHYSAAFSSSSELIHPSCSITTSCFGFYISVPDATGFVDFY